ncbi:MAG: glycosyltransferase family 39 protein [Patescibacteria group bacterium]
MFPLRLKSFGDYKLPLYSYLTVPAVGVFGLNEFSTRLVAGIAALVLVLGIYLFTKALFESEYTATVALLFAAFSPWIHTIARQAHETVLASAFMVISLYTLTLFAKTAKLKFFWLTICLLPFILFSYHTGKIIAPTVFMIALYFAWQKKVLTKLFQTKTVAIICAVVFVAGIGLFVVGEKLTPAERVKNLFILNNPDISIKTESAKIEERFSPFSSKLLVGIQEISRRYVSYFSPEFLTQHGDVNNRFGYPNISPVPLMEYVGFLIGIALVVFKWKKEFLVLGVVLLVAPLNGALTWQEYALTRVYPLIALLIPLSAYGITSFLQSRRLHYMTHVLVVLVILGSMLSSFYFFVHYPKKAVAVRSLQAGYRELADYIKENYSKFDHFYITKDNGQPYIYLLFYLRYSPKNYQKTAQLTLPDEFGFGQVTGFDKFTFSTDPYNSEMRPKKSVYVFSGEGGKILKVPEDRVKKIKIETEEMFWIFENP